MASLCFGLVCPFTRATTPDRLVCVGDCDLDFMISMRGGVGG
jgi:hypothetical protein